MSSFPSGGGNGQSTPSSVQQQQAAALAALVQQQSGTTTPTAASNGSSGLMNALAEQQQFQQQQQAIDRSLALHQQLATLMQQHSQPAAGTSIAAPLGGAGPGSSLSAFLPLSQSHQQQSAAVAQQFGHSQPTVVHQQQPAAVPQQHGAPSSALLGFYQQLLALQQAQQQQQQQGAAAGTPTVAALPQQFSNVLHLQNAPGAAAAAAAAVLQQQPSSQTPTPGTPAGAQQSAGSGGGPGLSNVLNGLLATNPALFHSLLGQQQHQQQPQQQQGSSILAALANQLLMPGAQQQQQTAAQPQPQSQLSLLQMLSPATATLYAYQNLMHQQQQQQAQQQQQQPTVSNGISTAQLQLLLQLLGGGAGIGAAGSGALQTVLAALGNTPAGSQQHQQLLAILAAQQQAAAQQQQQVVAPPPPDDSRLLLEQLIRQNREQQQQQQQSAQQQKHFHQQRFEQQQQQHLSLAAQHTSPSAVVNHAAGLADQHHLQQQQHHQSQQQQQQSSQSAAPAGTLLEMATQPIGQQQQQMAAAHQQLMQQQPHGTFCEEAQQQGHQVIQQQQQGNAVAGPSQQQSAEGRLLSTEAVQDRISRLISENEAIVEPNPVLLKRRPYQRQSTSNSMTSQTSETAGTSQRGSPGIRSPGPKLHPATTRSFSLHEASFLRMGGGSLTSGQPISRQQQQQLQLTCNFCHLKFPNEAGLEAHESRCSKKEQHLLVLHKQQSQPQLKLAAIQQQQQQQLQMQLQQLQEHQSTIAALVGGGKGVARDLLINGGTPAAIVPMAGGGGGGGRSSVPSLSNPGPVVLPATVHRQQQLLLGQSHSDSRLKKRCLDDSTAAGCGSANGTNSVDMVDVLSVAVGGSEQQQQTPEQPESVKIARIDHPHAVHISSCSSGQQPSCSSSLSQQQSLLLAELYHQQQQQQQNKQKQQQTQTIAVQQQHHQQAVAQQQLTIKDAIIYARTYCRDLRSTLTMPYFLTLTPAELDAVAALGQADCEIAPGAGHLRCRTRNITSETFVCLNKVRPTFAEQRDNQSAYAASWSVPSPADADAQQQLAAQLFLTACKSTSGAYSLAANRESVQLRTTHSSFWTQKQQQRTAQQSNNHQQLTMGTVDQEHLQQQLQMAEANSSACASVDYYEKMEVDEEEEPMTMIKLDPGTATEDKENKDNSSGSQHEGHSLKKEESEEDDESDDGERDRGRAAAAQLPVAARERGGRLDMLSHHRLPPSKTPRNEEVEVYIRGRGRGRYVCERCGIRCKKPSMLKKHLRSHTNVRPFTCLTCNFSFKTKGNLTKHLVSKAHRRRMQDAGAAKGEEYEDEGISRSRTEEEEEEEGEGRLVVADEEEEEMDERRGGRLPAGNRRLRQREAEESDWDRERRRQLRLGALERKFARGEYDRDDEDDDDEDEDAEDGDSPQGEMPPPPPGTMNYRRFGQENILVERETHTPPTLWMLCGEGMCQSDGESASSLLAGAQRGQTCQQRQHQQRETRLDWPQPDRERGCHSAPPAALCTPDQRRRRKKTGGKEAIKMAEEEDSTEEEEGEEEEVALSYEREEEGEGHHPQQPVAQLANFIPAVPSSRQTTLMDGQQPQGPPSLAAQLAAGLLQQATAPFHQQQPIGISPPAHPQQHQQQPSTPMLVLAAAASQQHHQQQQFQQSAFAPPVAHQQNNTNNNSLVTALKLLGQQMGAVAAAAAAANVDHEKQQQGTMATNGLMSSANADTFARAQSTLEAFLATEGQSLQCDLCDKKFRKESELALHKQTHLIARQQSAKPAFQCVECLTVVRSKSLLARHSESVHGASSHPPPPQAPGLGITSAGGVGTALAAAHPPAPMAANATQMLPPPIAVGGQSSSSAASSSSSFIAAGGHPNHLRNFLCTDCNLGFRSHGVLAKHLRSKNHVKNLVALGKLPEDANALLVKDHSKAMANIDAADCEKAYKSTKDLLARMREQLGLDGGSSAPNGGNPAQATANGLAHEDIPAPSLAADCQQQSSSLSSNSHALFPPIGISAGASGIGSQSPGPVPVILPSANGIGGGKVPRISSALGTSANRRSAEPLPHGLKRKSTHNSNMAGAGTAEGHQSLANEEQQRVFPQQQQRRDSFSSPSPQRPKFSREELIQPAESPLHSLAQVAAAAAAALNRLSPLGQQNNHHNGQQQLQQNASKAYVANVWVPPKLDGIGGEQNNSGREDCRKSSTPDQQQQQLQNGSGAGGGGAMAADSRLCSLLSNRSAEENSESTGTRSESSTPVQRNSTGPPATAGGFALGGPFSPMPTATRCQLCELNFDSPAELAVHFHADHVVMRHGKDFRCSRRNCDKVFPSRESLRAHIHAHFFGNAGATPGSTAVAAADSQQQQDSAFPVPCAASCPASPSSGLLARQRHAHHCGTISSSGTNGNNFSLAPPPPCAQSPGIPEESSSALSQLASTAASQPQQQSLSSPPSVAAPPSAANNSHHNKGEHRQRRTTVSVVNGTSGSQQQQQMLPPLSCQFCAEQLSDVQALQAHWVTRHMAQLAGSRPHVCLECDAGFTTEEALRMHRERQHGISGNTFVGGTERRQRQQSS